METLCNSRAVCVSAVLTFGAILPFASASPSQARWRGQPGGAGSLVARASCPCIMGKMPMPHKPHGVNSTIAPLKFDLPAPGFGSTPPNLTKIPNLEPLRKTPRPPFYAPAGATNLALGKPVAGTDDLPIIGELEMITDGDKRAQDGSFVELGPFVQHVTIDLEEACEIYAIVVWHWQVQARVYYDVIVQIADDADFITNARTVFNNDADNSAGLGKGGDREYLGSNFGKHINAGGVTARYVRAWSNGCVANEFNRYVELAVYGRPVDVWAFGVNYLKARVAMNSFSAGGVQ